MSSLWGWRRQPALAGVIVAVAVARIAVVASTRIGSLGGDVPDYLRGFTLHSAPHSPLATNLYTLLGDNHRAIVTAESIVAAVAWSVLAWTAFRVTRTRALGWAAALWILALSFSSYVLSWDSYLLTESLSLSMLALMVAAGLAIVAASGTAGGPVPRRAWVGLVVSAILWGLLRESQLLNVGVLAVVLLAIGAVAHRRRRTPPAVAAFSSGPGEALDHGRLVGPTTGPPRSVARAPLIAGAVLVVAVLAGLVQLAAVGGTQVIAQDTMGRDVLAGSRATPQVQLSPAAAYFHAHGMPVDAAIVRLVAGRKTSQQPAHAAALVAWRHWVDDHGEDMWVRYLATHPHFVVSQLLHDPIVLRPGITIRTYQIWHLPEPFSRAVVIDDRILFLGAAVVAVALAAWRRSWSLLVGAVVTVLAAVHIVTALFGEPLETARHEIVPLIQSRLGIALLALAALDHWWSRRSDGRTVDPAEPAPATATATAPAGPGGLPARATTAP